MSAAEDTLTTERLSLRRFTLDDAGLMLAVWNDPDFVANVGDRGIRSIEAAETALAEGALRMYEQYGYGPYCVRLRDTDEGMGICGLFRRPGLDDPDIGFGLLPPYRRAGYAHEAAVAVLRHARSALGLRRVTAIVSPANAASIGLIEKLGLRYDRRIRLQDDEDDVSLYAIEW